MNATVKGAYSSLSLFLYPEGLGGQVSGGVGGLGPFDGDVRGGLRRGPQEHVARRRGHPVEAQTLRGDQPPEGGFCEVHALDRAPVRPAHCVASGNEVGDGEALCVEGLAEGGVEGVERVVALDAEQRALTTERDELRAAAYDAAGVDLDEEMAA